MNKNKLELFKEQISISSNIASKGGFNKGEHKSKKIALMEIFIQINKKKDYKYENIQELYFLNK